MPMIMTGLQGALGLFFLCLCAALVWRFVGGLRTGRFRHVTKAAKPSEFRTLIVVMGLAIPGSLAVAYLFLRGLF
jgi:hypothetical protein